MPKTLVSLRIGDEEKKELEQMAAERDMTLADLLRDGAAFYGSLDSVFVGRIEQMAKRLQLPPWLVLQNIAIRRLAEDAAEEFVYGRLDKWLLEFPMLSGGAMTGERLFTMLFDDAVSHFRDKRGRELANREAKSPEKLNEEERAFLEKWKTQKEENERFWEMTGKRIEKGRIKVQWVDETE